jgi:hypothetical protein
MLKRFALFLMTALPIAASPIAMACRCAHRNYEALYIDSDFVYFAEVTLVRLVTKGPPHNARVVYEAELRPMRRFKGGDPGVQKLRYESTYHDNSPNLADDVGEGREFVINSCDHGYEIGQVFLIFKKRSAPLGTVGYCTAGVVPDPTTEHIRILEALAP